MHRVTARRSQLKFDVVRLVIGSLSCLCLVSCGANTAHQAQRATTHASAARIYDAEASPDGQRVAWVKYVRPSSNGSLQVMNLFGTTRTLYTSNDSCCTNLAWLSPRTLAFDDDYTVKLIDVTTRSRRTVASNISNFVAAQSGNLIAGYAMASHDEKQTIVVVDVQSRRCWLIPKPEAASDSDPVFTTAGSIQITRSRPPSSPRVLEFSVSRLPRTKVRC